jgi:hypothetical protein
MKNAEKSSLHSGDEFACSLPAQKEIPKSADNRDRCSYQPNEKVNCFWSRFEAETGQNRLH